MIQIYQQIIDKNHGDCMRAVIASLLELPLFEVPHFLELENTYTELINFVSKKGYEFDSFLYNHLPWGEKKYNTLQKLDPIKDIGIKGFYFAGVYSPKYFNYNIPLDKPYPHGTHAVVCDSKFNIVHDPNPGYQHMKQSNGFYTGYPLADIMGYNGIKEIMVINPKK